MPDFIQSGMFGVHVMPFSYWKNETGFAQQSRLLQAIFSRQRQGYQTNGVSDVSFETLAEQQRAELVGCIYLAGSRIDNTCCLGSDSVGLLISALPTDYAKGIVPSFHAEHSELVVGTHGEVVVEYSTSVSHEAVVEVRALRPGDFVLLERGWPHRISLAPLRSALSADVLEGGSEMIFAERLSAGFVAVKMGKLGKKSSSEDMSKWPNVPGHPLIDNWQADKEFLGHVCRNRLLCKRLSVPLDDPA